MAQTRRDLQSARDANSRLVEGNVAQERERVAVIAQLQQQNSALAARLAQAQGTLDQIASAARLGTPAAAIASGTPAPIPTVRTGPAGPAEVRYHTVTEGDSLSRISMRYYGTPNRWQEIYNANRDVLQGSSALRIGMQLRIP
ncbi:MAG: LysM peptidoglycan-binding domain-containing protein [Opitutae bacterium]|nr:LysM peptidoglycan-binding domain-containing protein [Opitutae bacterium]